MDLSTRRPFIVANANQRSRGVYINQRVVRGQRDHLRQVPVSAPISTSTASLCCSRMEAPPHMTPVLLIAEN